MGIPDETSWFRQSYLPGGQATGWRRVGCWTMLALAAGLLAVGIVVALAR
ncbi:MAG: hypothetical protein WEC34_06145 [Acidimicrobiia bacterium]|jgi:hypothetical protein